LNRRDEALLKLAADRAGEHPALLGWVLSQYVKSQKVTLKALLDELRCSEGALWRLALCRRPRSDRFRDDVAMIASSLAFNEGTLMRIIRHVDTLEAMKAGRFAESGALMAARKRRRSDQEGEDDEPSS
jgi:hypothetical protein